MTPDLLSVVLVNYNHAAYIGGQIGAILAQSYRNIELIILDDCSTDNSVAVIEAAIGNDPRVNFIKNEKNLGMVGNQEKGRALVKGEFQYLCAADDRVLPGFFEKSISALKQAPQAGMCFSLMAWLDHEKQSARPMPLWFTQQGTYLSPDDFCEVICGEHMVGAAVVTRRAAYEQAMPSAEDFKRLAWHADWFTFSVIACRQGACHIAEHLVAIHVAPGTFSGQGMYDWNRQQDVIATALRLLKTDAYRDVLPYFVRGALFSGLPHVGRLFLARPELWDMETFMLVQKPLADWNLERMQRQQKHWQQKQ